MNRLTRPVLFGLLLLLASVASAGQPTKRKPDPERGQEIFERSCWMCHGKEGRGDGPASSSLSGGVPSILGRVSDDDVEPSVPLVQAGRGRMPGFSDGIDLRDTRRVLKYVASLDDPKPVTTGGEAEPEEKSNDGQDAAPE